MLIWVIWSNPYSSMLWSYLYYLLSSALKQEILSFTWVDWPVRYGSKSLSWTVSFWCSEPFCTAKKHIYINLHLKIKVSSLELCLYSNLLIKGSTHKFCSKICQSLLHGHVFYQNPFKSVGHVKQPSGPWDKPTLEVNQPVACCQPDLHVKSESMPACLPATPPPLGTAVNQRWLEHGTKKKQQKKTKLLWGHNKTVASTSVPEELTINSTDNLMWASQCVCLYKGRIQTE